MVLTERQRSVTETMRKVPFKQLLQQVDPDFVPLNLAHHLQQLSEMPRQSQANIIAEWKRASISSGHLAGITEMDQQIRNYLWGGAVGISVLTEPKWFGGSLEDLVEARTVINQLGRTAILLRKDFIYHDYQILESIVAGADTILLIVKLLGLIWKDETEITHHLHRLLQVSRSYGMEPLVEVFTVLEIKIAVNAGAKVIGINNRDLDSLTVDPVGSVALLSHVPPQVTTVILSGITTAVAMNPYLHHGVCNFLIGTHLMLADNPSRQIAWLRRRPPLLKICGVTQIEEVEMLRHTPGVSMVGLVFAEGRHQITTEFAMGVREHLGGTAHRWSSHQTEPLVAEIAKVLQLNQRPLLVGVFSYQTTQQINEIATRVGLDLIQLHGPDGQGASSTDFVVPVIRSVGVTEGLGDLLVTVSRLRQRYPLLLFDTLVPGHLGGTGKSFPHRQLYSFRQQVEFGIAGGITPDKIGDIRHQLCPWLIDISSGVESRKHLLPSKDPLLVRAATVALTG